MERAGLWYSELRNLALTHRSYAFEQGLDRVTGTNERLEFLGDAVLGVTVAQMSYAAFPDRPEGWLAKLRAAIVNESALADVARELGLGDEVKLGKGELASNGQDKDSILADTLEAVIGATHLGLGSDAARAWVEQLFRPRMEAWARGEDPENRDYKTELQEIADMPPVYKYEESGPDHERQFRATVDIDGKSLGKGSGRSKKEAEQRAAREAISLLRAGSRGG
jgi:ribonuclease-3